MGPPLLDAAHPHRNASVSASAGTGKTWLLVTRLIRLLLDGARADGLLAVTFTRKAATEMQSRLRERLLDFTRATDESLRDELTRIGADATKNTMTSARGLYESLLRSTRTPRITTFHAFCHDLLKRFPLEAEVTPGFELTESTVELEREAMQALYAETTLNPDGPVAAALEFLYDHFGNASTEVVLRMFLEHRADWWAYTHDRAEPVHFAFDNLRSALAVDLDFDAAADFFSSQAALLLEFASLLDKHPTATHLANARILRASAASGESGIARLQKIRPVFLRADFQPLSRKHSDTQAKKMGHESELRFLQLHDQLSAALIRVNDIENAQFTLRISGAWFTAGSVLLQHFQRLKEERRLLDFTDLEWRTYSLLTSSGNAHWVQYKLDRRIDHLLIDEFQDTSPIQWHMLYPLLHELASSTQERSRTVFLVGDEKQSIYQFRRADPRLLRAAQRWLSDHMGAEAHSLDASRRSAPAIIDFVNAVFEQPALRDGFADFPKHQTHHRDLWGRVEVLPLAEAPEEPPREAISTFRNPLEQPRPTRRRTPYDEEGARVARKIRQLMDASVLIGEADTARPLSYSDVLILLRNRTHVGAYESALRAANIPFTGAERGTLLHSREIRDLVDLLDVLTSPFNNLALATVLRSPMFCCSDEDLSRLALAGEIGTWEQRLAAIATSLATDHPLQRAHKWISQWSEAAGRLPVHDLMDRIYTEGRVVQRFVAAAPPHLRETVRGNLAQFMDLALELDSGRYPSLGRFVESIREAQQGESDSPDAEHTHDKPHAVRLSTVHAAKGLEAPVVFLVDAASEATRSSVANVFVTWEPEHHRPDGFHIAGSRSMLDPVSRKLRATYESKREREELNLLYVALTRAKQMLFISGSRVQSRKTSGWYGLARSAMTHLVGDPAPDTFETGTRPTTTAMPFAPAVSTPDQIDSRLGQPLRHDAVLREIAPSRRDASLGDVTYAGGDDSNGIERGLAIHRMIELISGASTTDTTALRESINVLLKHEISDADFLAWRTEAERVVRSPDLREFFDNAKFTRAYSEVALVFSQGEQTVHGIVDRVVVRNEDICVLDFKTHRVETLASARTLAAQFREQMAWYVRGAEKLWPQRPIRAYIVFTFLPAAVEIFPTS